MLNQSAINAVSKASTKLFAEVESNILLPENMKKDNCEFEHSLTSNSTGHTYVVTVTERMGRGKKAGEHKQKLESTSMLELFTLIASFYEFDLAKTLE